MYMCMYTCICMAMARPPDRLTIAPTCPLNYLLKQWSYYPNSWGTLPGFQCGNTSATGPVQEPCGPLNWNRGPWALANSCNSSVNANPTQTPAQQTPIGACTRALLAYMSGKQGRQKSIGAPSFVDD